MSSNLIQLLQVTLDGCATQDMADAKVRQVIHSIIDDDQKELSTPDAADWLGKSEATLKRWRAHQCGPRYRKDAGGAVRYRMAWLKDYQTEGVVND
jgi:hypothetical protein